MLLSSSKVVYWTLLIAVLRFTSTKGEICHTVNKWNDLVRLTNAAMNTKKYEVCFKPFNIDKPQSSRLMLNRPIILRCDKSSTEDRCEIKGSGHHVRVAGKNAKVNIIGFTFIGATNSAVRVISTSTQTHTIDRCDFLQ